jgi:hypothetical protein
VSGFDVAINVTDPHEVADALDAGAQALLGSPGRRGASVHLPDHGSVLLTGDLHDNPVHLRRVVDAARLADGEDRHVVLHELIHGDRLTNGCDLSYRVLARAALLAVRHPGQVHVVLANHELAQAFRHPVSKGAGDNLEQFDAGLDWAFGDDAGLVEEAVGRFVRAMPLAVRASNGLFLAHSLPAPHLLDGFDLGILDRPLEDADYALRTGSAWRMVWGRGWDADELRTLAAAWGVRTFVLGHAYVEQGAEAPFPELLLLNSDHAGGRIVAVNLSEPCPSGPELVARSVALSALGGLDD